MTQVPSNLIPTRVTQLPESPSASPDGYLVFVYEGRTYKIRAGDIVTGVIPDGSITTAKLAGGAVTPDKLSTAYAKPGDNTDITSLSALTGMDFNTGTGIPAHHEGRVFYDAASHSLAYYNDDTSVIVNLGREQLVRVLNNTGSALVNGQVVYVNGASGGWPTATLAQANSAIASQSTLGLVTADIANGQYGYVCVSGTVNDVNTSSYPAGTRLYLSEITAGAWTSTAPLQPNYVVEIATVISSDSVSGKLFVRVDKSPWYPNAEIRDTRTSITLPTTPTVFAAQTFVGGSGFTYDAGTGVLTINQSGSYGINIQFNAEPSASNKNIYFYVEDSTNGGSTWNITRYSGRQLVLPNATETQVSVNAARYYVAGTKLRFYIWGDATVNLKTSDLPGTAAGTVTKPAYRFLIA